MLQHQFGRTATMAAVFTLGIAAHVYGQQPRMMLGAPNEIPDRFSTRYNIQYNDGGFSDPHPNNVKKSTRYLVNSGVPQNIVDKFSSFAHTMTGNPDWFGDTIDAAWERRRTDFVGCGGAWAQAAVNTSPSSLHITVQPTIWQYNPGTWAAGQTNNISGQHYIKAINVYVSGVTTNPSASDTVDFASIVEWEMGNALADAAGYHAANPSQEVGSQSPCSLVK
jgi:hypothetical protein